MKYNINTAHTIARFGKVVNIFCGDKSKPSPKSSSKKLWKRQGPFDTGFTGQKSTNPFRLKPSLGVFSCNLGYRKLVAKKKNRSESIKVYDRQTDGRTNRRITRAQAYVSATKIVTKDIQKRIQLYCKEQFVYKLSSYLISERNFNTSQNFIRP